MLQATEKTYVGKPIFVRSVMTLTSSCTYIRMGRIKDGKRVSPGVINIASSAKG